MRDLLAETRIPLATLGREENVAPSTTWRWALNGVRGVKLETFSVGAKRFTTREAFARFVAATSAAAAHGPMPSVSRTPRQRESAIRRAEKELAAEGI